MIMIKVEKKLGNVGELIVKEFLESNGFTVELSKDQYDSKKDMTAVKDNKTYTFEVKAQQAMVKYDAFTIKSNQLKKCSNVDFLFIVSAEPRIKNEYKHSNKIFYTRPKKNGLKTFVYEAGGNNMLGMYIDNFKCVGKLNAKQIRDVNKYTRSKYG